MLPMVDGLLQVSEETVISCVVPIRIIALGYDSSHDLEAREVEFIRSASRSTARRKHCLNLKARHTSEIIPFSRFWGSLK